MKRTFVFFCLMLFSGVLSFSQQNNKNNFSIKGAKSNFDIKQNGIKHQLKSTSIDESKKMIQNQVWEYSLMQNGYFTIGTNRGNSNQIIDDNCEIAFGHPYSMTSFAYPVFDGNIFYPYELSSNTDAKVFIKSDTLFFEQIHNGQIQLSTFIYINQTGNIEFKYQIKNIDNSTHYTGMGLIFDAALGKWGDGYVKLNNDVLDSVTKLSGAGNDSLVIWERKQVPKGLGVQINFDENVPDDIIIGNWYNEYTGDTTIQKLYDLALHTKWEETELLPNDSVSFIISFSILDPDYDDQLFIRWDMPNSLSIENQQLFPSDLITNTLIINNSKSNNGLILKIEESDYVYGWETKESFSLSSPNELYFQPATVQIPEIYDSLVIPFTLQLVQSEIIVDELTRNIFIPAAPFSDTGLVVTIDTAYINYSKVYFSFHCAMEETGQLIFNLHKNNIFLFENDVPVEEFTLEKDTSGGTNNTDIIFVLDVTGSMSNEIAGVRDNIIEFADSLSYKGINYRLGMVTFLDVIENIYDFTEDVQEFQMNVSAQYAHGGDDRPENSLDALSVAAQFSFRENASRIIIWITDADFHINDHITQQTKETVINQLLAMGITVNCIGDPLFQTDYYDQIVMNTGGGFFNINENFRDILLEVSRLNQATNHLVSFYHPGIIDPGDEFKIEVHYAGLGGKDSISFGSGLKSMSEFNGTEVIVYPNPFFHHPHLIITGSESNTYRLEVYNIQGQLLNTKVINEKSQVIDIELSELLNQSDIGSNQIFFLKTITMSPKGDILNYETKKIKKF